MIIEGLWISPWNIEKILMPSTVEKKRRGGNVVTRSMHKFNNFTETRGLIDMEMKRAEFTWTNNQHDPDLCKLDRFLIYHDMMNILPSPRVMAVTRITSDHIPIMPKKYPFRFLLSWFKEPAL